MLISWQLLVFVAFCGVAAIQLFYYLWFFRRVGAWLPPDRAVARQHPVSVIVCARDEDENLARNLPGLLFQEYGSSAEVLVVNDNSVDDTRYVLDEFQRTHKHLRIVDLQQEAKLIAGKNIRFPSASRKRSTSCCC